MKDGLFVCAHNGCGKNFDEKANTDISCSFHTGGPMFHDGKKYWTCCKKEAVIKLIYF